MKIVPSLLKNWNDSLQRDTHNDRNERKSLLGVQGTQKKDILPGLSQYVTMIKSRIVFICHPPKRQIKNNSSSRSIALLVDATIFRAEIQYCQ